jgi:hypothetical protein
MSYRMSYDLGTNYPWPGGNPEWGPNFRYRYWDVPFWLGEQVNSEKEQKSMVFDVVISLKGKMKSGDLEIDAERVLAQKNGCVAASPNGAIAVTTLDVAEADRPALGSAVYTVKQIGTTY